MQNPYNLSLWQKNLIIGEIFVFLAFSPAANGGSEELGFASDKGIGLSIRTDKAAYLSGEPITIVLTAFNHTRNKVIFYFNSSQKYDFFYPGSARKRGMALVERQNFCYGLGNGGSGT